MSDWRASLLAKADYPESHLAIGGAALVMRNPRAAEAAFREAVRLDPQRAAGWVMIARILAATGRQKEAREEIIRGLAANPGDPVLGGYLDELDNLARE